MSATLRRIGFTMNDAAKPSPLRLSRAPGDRILLGALAMTLAFLSGWGCWLALFKSARVTGATEILAKLAIDDAVLAVFVLCLLALVWAIAAPPALERLLERRALTALLAVSAAAPVTVICLWFR